MCTSKDNPETETLGDCVRACLASMLELPSRDVPHFFEKATTPQGVEQANIEMQRWFAKRGQILAPVGLPGAWSKEEFFAFMTEAYPDHYYMLWANFGGDHAAVCRNGEIAHNPAWYRTPIEGPHSSNMWIAFLIVGL